MCTSVTRVFCTWAGAAVRGICECCPFFKAFRMRERGVGGGKWRVEREGKGADRGRWRLERGGNRDRDFGR